MMIDLYSYQIWIFHFLLFNRIDVLIDAGNFNIIIFTITLSNSETMQTLIRNLKFVKVHFRELCYFHKVGKFIPYEISNFGPFAKVNSKDFAFYFGAI